MLVMPKIAKTIVFEIWEMKKKLRLCIFQILVFLDELEVKNYRPDKPSIYLPGLKLSAVFCEKIVLNQEC